MDQFLKGLYGASDADDEGTKAAKANDFVSRVESGNKAEGYSTEEAVQNYKSVTSNLSDDEFEGIAADALRQLTPEQRREFTSVVKREAGVDLDDNTDDPQELAALAKQFRSGSGGMGGMLGGLLGGGSGGSDDIMGMLGGLLGGGGSTSMPGGTGGMAGSSSQAGLGGLLGNPIVKMVLGLIAAEAMKRMMGGGGQSAQAARVTPSSGSRDNDGGGGFLDSIFGGGDDRASGSDSGGGGLLGGLFGGNDDEPDKRDSRSRDVDVSRIEQDKKPRGV
jgi:hypothetical protein